MVVTGIGFCLQKPRNKRNPDLGVLAEGNQGNDEERILPREGAKGAKSFTTKCSEYAKGGSFANGCAWP